MLYVSRYDIGDKYGICDSDDMVEEVVTFAKVSYNSYTLGIKIHGVEIKEEKDEIWDELHVRVRRIFAYQVPEYSTRQQAKLKTLYGIDVKVWDGMVTSVTCDERRVSAPVRLRLSDFAAECGSCIFHCNQDIGFHKLIVVLDDKITFGQYIFNSKSDDYYHPGKSKLGIAIDVSEVSDDEQARFAYNSYIHGSRNPSFNSIYDKSERKNLFMAMYDRKRGCIPGFSE